MSLLLLLVSVASAQEPLTLQQAWDRALAANSEIREARIELDAAGERVRQAKGSFDPTLSVGVEQGRVVSQSNDTDATGGEALAAVESHSRGWSAAVSQSLPTGGAVGLAWRETLSASDSAALVEDTTWDDGVWLTLQQPLLDGVGPLAARAGVRRAARDLQKEDLDYRSSQEKLVVDVAGAYWRAVVSTESLGLACRSLDVAQRQRDETQERKNNGFSAEGDVLQVERQVGVARQAVVSAEAEVEEANLDLCRILGISLSVCPTFAFSDAPQIPEQEVTVDVALTRAREANVTWRRAQLDIAQSEDDQRQARLSALPSLDLAGTVGTSGMGSAAGAARDLAFSSTYPSWSVGVDLGVPLPGRVASASLATARLSVDAARLRLDAAAQDLEREVRRAIRDVHRDRERVALARDTVHAAEKALQLDQELYGEGRATSREVVLSLEALDEAQAQRLAAEVDFQQSVLTLEQVQGIVLARVGR